MFWLCGDVLINVVQKMNHSSFLLRLQSFFGKSQQLILSGFDGGSPPFGFGIAAHQQGDECVEGAGVPATPPSLTNLQRRGHR